MGTKIPRSAMHMDTTNVATLFGTTPKNLIDWEKRAGQERKSFKVQHGIYNLQKLLAWWLENIYESKQETAKAKNSRERYWDAKAEEAEINVQKIKEILFPRAEISGEWCKRLAEIRQGLLSLPVKLPALLDGKPQDEMRPVIKEAVTRLLSSYSRTGKFTPEEKKKK